MTESFPGILTLLLGIPMLAAVVIIFIPRSFKGGLFGCALLFTVLDLLWSIWIFFRFNPVLGDMQFVERVVWIPSYRIEYFIGIDGLSLFLVLLTTFLGPVAILASWNITDKVKEYLVLILILQTSMLGTLLALDLFLFYVFWEAMLIPMYFIIGVWGGPRRIYAALKFVIYTMSGSLIMLIGIIALVTIASQTNQTIGFDVIRLYDLRLSFEHQMWLFLAFALSFAIKVPLFPFHTWLPDAHVEAPTARSVILAGVLLKMGTYCFLRFAIPLFPDVAHAAAPYISTLAVIGVVYGALVAMMQTDLKKLVAYSSVSHLGLVMLGLFALNFQGLQGAIYHMLSHGLSTGALFLAVGMIYERRHTRMIADFGGLWRSLPVFSIFFLVITFSSIGLPGLNGFVGEFLIFLGAFKSLTPWAIIAASGIVLAAIYMLWMYRRVVFGPIIFENQILKDIGTREIMVLAPILALIVFMGIYPKPILDRIAPSVEKIIARTERSVGLSRQMLEKRRPMAKEGARHAG